MVKKKLDKDDFLKNPGPIPWHTFLLATPLLPANASTDQFDSFHQQTTPRHYSQAHFGSKYFVGSTDGIAPPQHPSHTASVMDSKSKKRKNSSVGSGGSSVVGSSTVASGATGSTTSSTKSQAKSASEKLDEAARKAIGHSAMEKAANWLSKNFGLKAQIPTQPSKKGGGCHKLPQKPLDGTSGCLVCSHCLASGLEVVILCGTCIFRGKNDTLTGGFYPTLLFPHNCNCQSNLVGQQNSRDHYTTHGKAFSKVNSDVIFMEDLVDVKNKFLDSRAFNIELFMNDTNRDAISVGTEHHGFTFTDDRSQFRMPPRNPDDVHSLFHQITPEIFSRVAIRYAFAMAISIGIENEMCPFVHYQWKGGDDLHKLGPAFTEGAYHEKQDISRYAIPDKARFRTMHMWLPNPGWHLFNAAHLFVAGGAASDPLTLEPPVHQIRHTDHPGPYDFIDKQEHPLFQGKEDALTLPGSSGITFLEEQDRTMYFRHPSNTVTNKYNQLLMWKMDEVHGGFTEPCSDSLYDAEHDINKGKDSYARKWRPILFAHLESIHITRDIHRHFNDVGCKGRVDNKYEYIDAAHMKFMASRGKREAWEHKAKDVQSTANAVIEDYPNNPHAYQLTNIVKAQMLISNSVLDSSNVEAGCGLGVTLLGTTVASLSSSLNNGAFTLTANENDKINDAIGFLQQMIADLQL